LLNHLTGFLAQRAPVSDMLLLLLLAGDAILEEGAAL